MKRIIFEGTKEELQNVLNLINDFDEDRLPKMTIETEHDILLNKLADYISEDNVSVAYNKLFDQYKIDGNVMADDIVTMWEPLENRYTISQLFDLIK